MIYLGKIQTLKVTKITDNGVYLSSLLPSEEIHKKPKDSSIVEAERILLPKNQVPPETTIDNQISVFVYKDSEDRPIATTTHPLLTLSGIATLKVKEITTIGAFLDWGLAKDLLLPFKEQTYRPITGEEVIVSLYIDKSKRLCATMKIYNYLLKDSNYKKDDKVTGKVYEIIENFGAFVAVDYKYSALIPKKELFTNIKLGDVIEARVTSIHEDGKLNLGLREKAHIQMDTDAEIILNALKATKDGFLPYHDKTDPEIIKTTFHLSKNGFKRAIGHLMKAGQIDITEQGIRLK